MALYAFVYKGQLEWDIGSWNNYSEVPAQCIKKYLKKKKIKAYKDNAS